MNVEGNGFLFGRGFDPRHLHQRFRKTVAVCQRFCDICVEAEGVEAPKGGFAARNRRERLTLWPVAVINRLYSF